MVVVVVCPGVPRGGIAGYGIGGHAQARMPGMLHVQLFRARPRGPSREDQHGPGLAVNRFLPAQFLCFSLESLGMESSVRIAPEGKKEEGRTAKLLSSQRGLTTSQPTRKQKSQKAKRPVSWKFQ